MYKDILVYRKTSNIMDKYMITISLAIFIDWLLLSYFTKNMGLYVPIFIISIYYIISEFGGFLEHYFHNIDARIIFIVVLIMDVLQLFTMFVHFYNIELFTYILVVIFSIQALLYEIYSIKIIQLCEIYEKGIKISKIQSYLLFIKSNMVVLGLVLSVIYSLFFINYDYLICLVISLGIFSIYQEIYLIKYIKELKI